MRAFVSLQREKEKTIKLTQEKNHERYWCSINGFGIAYVSNKRDDVLYVYGYLKAMGFDVAMRGLFSRPTFGVNSSNLRWAD